MSDIKVYVTSYARYNSGKLAGKWLDLSDYWDKDSFLEDAKAVISEEEEPELMFSAIESDVNLPSSLIPESFIHPELFDLLQENIDFDAMVAYIGYTGSADCAIEHFDDAYRGEYKSMKDFAEEHLAQSEEWQNLPDYVHYYFDFEFYAEADLFVNEYTFIDGYVFDATI